MGYPPGGVPPSATLEGGTRWRQVICDAGANDAGYSGRDGVERSGTEPSEGIAIHRHQVTIGHLIARIVFELANHIFGDI